MIDLDDIDSHNIFLYVWVIVVILFIFDKLDIKLNIIYGSAIGFMIIYWYNSNKIQQIKSNQVQTHTKISKIQPLTQNITKHQVFIDFLFSVQDLYIYNPQAYNEMVINIDHFIDLYDESILDNSSSGSIYNTMKFIKTSALNALHSIIIKLPPDISELLVEKLNSGIGTLESILNNYLDRVESINQNYLIAHGLNHRTQLVDKFYLGKNLFDTSDDPKYKNIHSYMYF